MNISTGFGKILPKNQNIVNKAKILKRKKIKMGSFFLGLRKVSKNKEAQLNKLEFFSWDCS